MIFVSSLVSIPPLVIINMLPIVSIGYLDFIALERNENLQTLLKNLNCQLAGERKPEKMVAID